MPQKELPKKYKDISKRYKKLITAVENLGKTTRAIGPIGKKNSHLIQLAAAAACGAKKSEIYHAIILLTSTIGFPGVVAAISWADDIIEKK